MALPLKPDSNVIRITSLDMESASETASEMDEGVLDGFPPLAVASSTTDRPRNPVDAKIEELTVLSTENDEITFRVKITNRGLSKQSSKRQGA